MNRVFSAISHFLEKINSAFHNLIYAGRKQELFVYHVARLLSSFIEAIKIEISKSFATLCFGGD